MNRLIALTAVLAMLCICFTGCRLKKDNDPTDGQTEPSSVLSTDPTDESTAPITVPTLPEDMEIPGVTQPTRLPADSTEPTGNVQNGGSGPSNSGGNQNGGSAQTPPPTDPPTPPTTQAPAPPITTDPIPETSEPKVTEPFEDEKEDRIELPVVPWPSSK